MTPRSFMSSTSKLTASYGSLYCGISEELFRNKITVVWLEQPMYVCLSDYEYSIPMRILTYSIFQEVVINMLVMPIIIYPVWCKQLYEFYPTIFQASLLVQAPCLAPFLLVQQKLQDVGPDSTATICHNTISTKLLLGKYQEPKIKMKSWLPPIAQLFFQIWCCNITEKKAQIVEELRGGGKGMI